MFSQVLCIAIAASTALRAADAAAESLERMFLGQLEARKVSLDIVDKPAGSIAFFVASFTSVNIVADPEISNSPALTMSIKNQTIAHVFKLFIEKGGLDWSCEDDAVYIFQKGKKRPALKSFTPGAEWERDLKNRLQRKISFEFADKALDESIAWLRVASNESILLDPRFAAKGRLTSSIIRVTGMSLETALLWLMRVNSLDCRFCDEALFIHEKDVFVPKPAAPLNDAQREILTAAIAGLSSDNFDTRESATTAIVNIGFPAAPMLEAESKKTVDNEVLLRIQSISKRILPYDPFYEPPEVTETLAAPAFSQRISFEFVDMPLEEAARHLRSVSRIELTLGDNDNSPVSVRIHNMELRSAMRWVARYGGTSLSKRGGKLYFERH